MLLGVRAQWEMEHQPSRAEGDEESQTSGDDDNADEPAEGGMQEPRAPAPPCRVAPLGAEPRRPTEPCRPTKPRRPTEPHCPACAAPAATTTSAATAATTNPAATAAMASPTILIFDAEGRAVEFDMRVDDLQLFLQCDSRDGVSLFDHTSGVSTDIARGFSQREGVDFFHTFSPTPKMTTLRVLLHVAAQRDYELHSLDFSTAFLQGAPRVARRTEDDTCSSWALALVKAELQERHTCTDLGPPALWLPILLATAHSPIYRPLALNPPLDESKELSGPYPELVGCLMHRKVHWDAAKRVLCYLRSISGMGLVVGGRGSVVLTGHSDASWADDHATQRSSQGYTFSLGSGSVSWRSPHSFSVLGSSCEAEIYAGAMAAQELPWLTYLLTYLGERTRCPPVLYIDNKAMLALCHEQRLEHRTKHIALRYFLARELQQRRQLRLSYVASRANTADVFTKALGSGDHQRFYTTLGLVPTLPCYSHNRLECA
ncbi:unnamed protein product [Closterium sp. NIES-54]